MKLSAKRALDLVDYLLSDDLCEDASSTVALNPETMTIKEKAYAEKLSLLYRVAHGCNSFNSCFDAHTSWRKEAEKLQEARGISDSAEPRKDRQSSGG